MDLSSQFALVLAAGIIMMPGCASWHTDTQTVYQTIEANPRRNTERAIRQHQKAAKIINRHLGDRHFHADLREAEEHLQQALVADVTYGPAHNSLGILYFWRRDLYLAAWEFEYAQKLMPDAFEPLYNLGMVYEKGGKLDQAIEYYQMALDIKPNSAAVLGNLARARLLHGDSVEAVRPLLEELQFADQRADWLAWAAEQLGLNPIEFVSGEASSATEETPHPAESAETPEDDEENPSNPNSIEDIPELPPLQAPAGSAHLEDDVPWELSAPDSPFAAPLLSE